MWAHQLQRFVERRQDVVLDIEHVAGDILPGGAGCGGIHHVVDAVERHGVGFMAAAIGIGNDRLNRGAVETGGQVRPRVAVRPAAGERHENVAALGADVEEVIERPGWIGRIGRAESHGQRLRTIQRGRGTDHVPGPALV